MNELEYFYSDDLWHDPGRSRAGQRSSLPFTVPDKLTAIGRKRVQRVSFSLKCNLLLSALGTLAKRTQHDTAFLTKCSFPHSSYSSCCSSCALHKSHQTVFFSALKAGKRLFLSKEIMKASMPIVWAFLKESEKRLVLYNSILQSTLESVILLERLAWHL